MKYIKVGWPEVQDFMIVESDDTIYFDPQKNVWFVSEELYNKQKQKCLVEADNDVLLIDFINL